MLLYIIAAIIITLYERATSIVWGGAVRQKAGVGWEFHEHPSKLPGEQEPKKKDEKSRHLGGAALIHHRLNGKI